MTKMPMFYVRTRLAHRLNVPLSPDETLCVDPAGPEVIGCLYENFKETQPKIYRALMEGSKSAKEMAVEFFELFFRDMNSFLSPLRSKKALLTFLKSERLATRSRVYA